MKTLASTRLLSVVGVVLFWLPALPLSAQEGGDGEKKEEEALEGPAYEGWSKEDKSAPESVEPPAPDKPPQPGQPLPPVERPVLEPPAEQPPESAKPPPPKMPPPVQRPAPGEPFAPLPPPPGRSPAPEQPPAAARPPAPSQPPAPQPSEQPPQPAGETAGDAPDVAAWGPQSSNPPEPAAKPSRFARRDLGIATGFGVGATGTFSRSTSVLWKISGEFFFDRVGFSPYIVIDKGREYSNNVDTYFLAVGLQLKYRFWTEGVVQPYLSAGASVATYIEPNDDEVTIGPNAGVGCLFHLSGFIYIHLDAYLLFPMIVDENIESSSVRLGDVVFVSTLGLALLF